VERRKPVLSFCGYRQQVGCFTDSRWAVLQTAGGLFYRQQVGCFTDSRWAVLQTAVGLFYRQKVGCFTKRNKYSVSIKFLYELRICWLFKMAVVMSVFQFHT
jgi:hypothetical protein